MRIMRALLEVFWVHIQWCVRTAGHSRVRAELIARRAGAALALLAACAAGHATTLPPGFQEVVFADQLIQPTAVRFASDGRIFVAEKRGVVKYFNSINDRSAKPLIDIRTNVYNFWDRGLLGMALHPNFPSTPYLYLLYTYDADIGGRAPKYGTPNTDSDPCPTPPGATADGCVVSGRLSRFTVVTGGDGALMVGAEGERVMIEDWCQQYPSHSIGSVVFGQDGKLYVSAGDGASFNFVDTGQVGNPCGDPPNEGGALRSQDIRTAGDPLGLGGSVLRVDPETGAPAGVNGTPIIATGLRNPFRINVRPGANNEIWIGDVGWEEWEEINVIGNTTDGVLRNFGWPCYEGTGRQAGYEAANLPICRTLYATPGAVTPPFHAYSHAAKVLPNDPCPAGSSAIAGVAIQFYSGSAYPSKYNGALFWADYSRKCIWAMTNGTNGTPNPASIENFAVGAAGPVDLQISPSGELFYADLDTGSIRRIQYTSAANRPPTAVISTSGTTGAAPLSVNFNGAGSSDPDAGDTLGYAWDLDGNGAFDNGSGSQASFVYTQPGTYAAKLRVTDPKGASSEASVVINVGGNTAPTASIASPAAATRWKVGDVISFSGSASDTQDGPLPGARMSWSLVLFHCDTQSNCHQHPIQTYTGAGGSFTAPDHAYPSYLQLTLTATDSGGLASSQTLRLDPQTTVLTFQTTPNGIPLAFGSVASATPFSRTVIVGSRNTITAPNGQKGAQSYGFQSWSDNGAQTHEIVAPAAATTYVARYRK